MAPIYLFTWNLANKTDAHDLAVEHLAQRGTKNLFIACMQELPGKSLISQARKTPLATLASRRIAVVPTPRLVPGLALVHHPDLTVERVEIDEDGEFITAIFALPASRKRLGVVGLHAKSKVGMHRPEDQGGSRALLRHEINQLRLTCDHKVILGDFNSPFDAREVQSWHCFYALSGSSRPLSTEGAARRRGIDHPPLYVVRPRNADALGTFVHSDSGSAQDLIVDFIAVDEATRAGSSSEILTTVSAKSIWDPAKQRPGLSDHLPVEGTVHI